MIDIKPYSSDLTDEQFSHIRLHLPMPREKGRWRSPQQQRELLNAMFYVVHTGCQWRELPHDFPAWQRCMAIFRTYVKREFGKRSIGIYDREYASKMGVILNRVL